ncbi:hypothetical protein WICMUC_002880 [Wickerhamomyces mucosus]|uniref:Uncharacterized protein n=1 Tax=Wickerhamomyces mucosus TaxID=1378264 RepID=A0A9P8TD32_9ASCO|nr:hypothetical protein WICMUC_002880 [Wickerhamomyces mucosus]
MSSWSSFSTSGSDSFISGLKVVFAGKALLKPGDEESLVCSREELSNLPLKSLTLALGSGLDFSSLITSCRLTLPIGFHDEAFGFNGSFIKSLSWISGSFHSSSSCLETGIEPGVGEIGFGEIACDGVGFGVIGLLITGLGTEVAKFG